VHWAAGEVRLRGVPLRIVHGFDWPARPHVGDPGLGVDPRQALLGRARRWLREAEQAARSTSAEPLEVTADLRVAHPVELLVHDSAGSSLVVLGSRGLGGFTELLVGSVAVGVAARAATPVAVVRGDAAASGPVVVGVDGSPLSESALAYAYAAADAYRVPLVAVHTWDRHAMDPLFERVPMETWEPGAAGPAAPRDRRVMSVPDQPVAPEGAAAADDAIIVSSGRPAGVSSSVDAARWPGSGARPAVGRRG
jgi:nucleotide-binding universal stress UspA family protein